MQGLFRQFNKPVLQIYKYHIYNLISVKYKIPNIVFVFASILNLLISMCI